MEARLWQPEDGRPDTKTEHLAHPYPTCRGWSIRNRLGSCASPWLISSPSSLFRIGRALVTEPSTAPRGSIVARSVGCARYFASWQRTPGARSKFLAPSLNPAKVRTTRVPPSSVLVSPPPSHLPHDTLVCFLPFLAL